MKSLGFLVLFAVPALLASPITVFSTFGPGQSYGGTNINVTGSSSPMGYEALAVPFTPSASVDLFQVNVAFNMLDPFLGGDGSFTLNLLADEGNQPGALLADLGILIAQSSPSVLTATCTTCPNLVAGNQYWLAAIPAAANTGAGWFMNDQNLTGRLAFLAPPFFPTWTVQNGWTLPAFDVLGNVGTPVPEPATGWLVAIVAACIAFGKAHNPA